MSDPKDPKKAAGYRKRDSHTAKESANEKRPIITVRNLTMGWGEKILQENASFDVPRGATFGILGGSGCGKSTMLRYLIGLEKPMSGTIDIEGIGEPNLDVGRPRYGVMFQSGALFGSMTVEENLSLALKQWSKVPEEFIADVVAKNLALVGLDGSQAKMPSELSGGMKKRVAIARALALEPSLIFLDEPSAGLDPVASAELDALILRLNHDRGTTVVMVTHELESIFSVISDAIYLDKETKTILAQGCPRDLKTDTSKPTVHAFFNRTPRKDA
jgi:phospholipid/cholesterol/gamma-HCH transport system ATP-binding protein